MFVCSYVLFIWPGVIYTRLIDRLTGTGRVRSLLELTPAVRSTPISYSAGLGALTAAARVKNPSVAALWKKTKQDQYPV